MKLKQMPRYTSMALMKQLALGREVRAPIISVVIVRTVVTPLINGRLLSENIYYHKLEGDIL